MGWIPWQRTLLSVRNIFLLLVGTRMGQRTRPHDCMRIDTWNRIQAYCGTGAPILSHAVFMFLSVRPILCTENFTSWAGMLEWVNYKPTSLRVPTFVFCTKRCEIVHFSKKRHPQIVFRVVHADFIRCKIPRSGRQTHY